LTTAKAVASEPRTRKLRRGPLTRKQILDAALQLFSEKGTARASVRDIAQAAGITDAAIYYHFPSKRELFEALIEERGITTALEGLERAEVRDMNLTAAGAICRIAQNALELMYANRSFLKVLMVEAMAEDPVATEEYRMLVERWEKAEARILRYFAREGELHSDDIDELANQLVTTVIGAFADFLMSPMPEPSNGAVPPQLAKHVDSAMRHIAVGIGARD
jgi:AcrR family transcriptional regulator